MSCLGGIYLRKALEGPDPQVCLPVKVWGAEREVLQPD